MNPTVLKMKGAACGYTMQLLHDLLPPPTYNYMGRASRGVIANLCGPKT